MPEEAFGTSLGGKARTVADIVYEANLVNDHLGLVVRGEPAFDWPDEGWIRAPENLRAKATVIQSFDDSSGRLVEALESLSEEGFLQRILTEEGETTPFERCRFATLHLWYHSGQLNFMQTLLGDDGWHWD